MTPDNAMTIAALGKGYSKRRTDAAYRRISAITAMGLALVVLGAVFAPLGAQDSAKTYVNVSTGFCLDSNAEGKVYALACNGGNYQNWKRQGKSMVNVSTGFCLDGNAEGKVYTLTCNGGNYQNWEKRGDNYVSVSTGFCLDSNAKGEVYALACNGGNYQNWK
jgi:hypothetical protein